MASIVLLSGLFTVSGVAGASSQPAVRIPMPSRSGTTTRQVVVARGDHLWGISAGHLGAQATDSEIAPYWREVVTVNTPRLRSGDPDLIYPGEVIELP